MTTRRPKVPRVARPATGSGSTGAGHRTGAPGGSASGGPGSAPGVTPLRGPGSRTGSGGAAPDPRRKPAGGAGRAGSTVAPGPAVPARTFSGRMLTLAVILVAVTVLLSPTVRVFLQQRGELEALRAEIAAQEQTQQALRTEVARWDDPAYIKQQARDRINLVMPGEKKYMVIGTAEGGETPAGESPGEVRTDLPWVDALWDSVQRSATD